MFRRKEDELNDAENTTGQSGVLSGFTDSATVIAPERSTSAATASSSSASSAGSNSGSAFHMNSTSARAADTPARTQPMQASASTSFRAPTAPEPRRPALPEAKAPLPPVLAQPLGTPKETRRVLTVGADILLKGEVATCDRLVIEGQVDAVLKDVGTMELAESGTFKGIAQVQNAEISGLFEGELVVTGRLMIYSSGRVCGKITYGEVEIERGGEISGEIKTVSSTGVRANAKKDDKVAA